MLEIIQAVKAPPRFDKQFLQSLEFKSPSDRLIVGVLKSLRFIGDDGAPTDRYQAFLDRTRARGILADAIREAYADLFRANLDAQNLAKSELIFRFRKLSRGRCSDAVTKKMTITFMELCKLADFRTSSGGQGSSTDNERTPDGRIKDKHAGNPAWQKLRVDGFVYNVQIVAPESSGHAEGARVRGWTPLRVFLTAIAAVAFFGALLYA